MKAAWAGFQTKQRFAVTPSLHLHGQNALHNVCGRSGLFSVEASYEQGKN